MGKNGQMQKEKEKEKEKELEDKEEKLIRYCDEFKFGNEENDGTISVAI